MAYLYLPGAFTEVAEALLEHDPDWCRLFSGAMGFRNILAGYMRRERLT